MGKIKLIIADDHPMVIDGLVGYFNNQNNIEVVATISNAKDILSKVGLLCPDVLLLDYHFTYEELTGIELCQKISEKHPFTRVIAISSFADIILVKKFIAAGAKGYVLKTATRIEFIDAVHAVFIGGEYFSRDISELMVRDRLQNQTNQNIKFTSTEKEIIKLIVEGHSTTEIAKKLFREKSTIDSHRKNILAKFQQMDKDNPSPSKNILNYILKFNIVGEIDNL